MGGVGDTGRPHGRPVSRRAGDGRARRYLPTVSAPSASPDLLAGLNPDQREAVTTVDGPVLVVAGAGSGKTRVLTHRVAHLIRDHGVGPFEVLAITFTNKAAGEMRERVSAMVGERLGRAMWVTTFHKACVRILRRELDRLGYDRSFSIYDQQDSRRLIKQVMDAQGIGARGRLKPRSVQYAISSAKDTLVDHEAYAEQASGWPESAIAEVYEGYQQRLRQANALDFDDLIMKTVEVLRLFPAVCGHYQRRFSHLLIDEYQDTNRAQYHLVNLLAAEHRNLMVVGDSDQGVYSFRGATIENLRDFERDYPDAAVITLNRNYRSTQTILDAANAVIDHNTDRREKHLWTDRGAGAPVVRYHADDEHDEAAFVSEEVERLHREEDLDFDDVAVFYRTNAQSRVLEDVFLRVGTPYRIIGGLRFYERREIKDVLAYATVLVNPADDVAARRIVNTPRRGIGDKTVEAVDFHARREGIPFLAAAEQAEHIDRLSSRQVGAVTAFTDLIAGLRTFVAEGATVPGLLEEIWDRTGYMAELEAEDTVEAVGRQENLQELAGVAAEYEQARERAAVAGGVPEEERREGLEAVSGFLESVALVTEQDQLADEAEPEADDPEGAVTMMTLHNAKGLEYPVVFIVGMEDGVFPHSRSMDDREELEEERRLCYVGVTRARDRLYVAHADHRRLYGRPSRNPPSRFLEELPDGLVEHRGPARGGSSRSRAGGDGHRDSAGRRARDAEVMRIEGRAFSVGDAVIHSRYGRGEVLDLSGSGETAEATVHFEVEGTKHLVLAYAPLVRA